jgi:large subunit ribosomal protein L15
MIKKRSKKSRIRGRRSCGYGFRKKHRGKGSKAGKGMAGTGKMAGQRKLMVLKYMPNYLGKKGFKSRKKKLKTINLEEINKRIESGKEKELNLKNFKVLGKGKITKQLVIHAKKFSKKAKEKIEAAGGKAIES